MKRSLLLLLLILACAGAGGWWYFGRANGKAPAYQTMAVTRGPMSQVVTATGTLNPLINVTVGSQISGIIQQLDADFNSPVKAGGIVAKLDPATYQATVLQAKGDLALAQAALALAKRTAERTRELRDQNNAAEADLDVAIATLDQAKATVQLNEANLQRAEVDLERCTIRSPIDGIVISRNVDVGQTVAASLNAPVLFTIANDLTKMQIYTNVAEADIGMVKEGQEAEFSVDAFREETFRGTVAQVRNAATTVQNIVTYNVVVAVENLELKLKPGMTAIVSFVVAHRDDAVKVPNAALRYRPPEAPGGSIAAAPPKPQVAPKTTAPAEGPGKPARQAERVLYMLPAGSAQPEPVTVTLGISDGFATEVVAGLAPGDLVITGATSQDSAARNPLLGR